LRGSEQAARRKRLIAKGKRLQNIRILIHL